MDQVAALERAILERAGNLAAEYRERAERSRDSVLREASERLRLREEREVLLAKAQAERAYRRQVQANELKLRAQLDKVRWGLVKGVEERLLEEATSLADDRAVYRPILGQMLAAAASALPEVELVAEFNDRDRKDLQTDWDAFRSEHAPDRRIDLGDNILNSVGGALVRTRDARLRLDNTFEGRLRRLRALLHQTIAERLLPGGLEAEGMSNLT